MDAFISNKEAINKVNDAAMSYLPALDVDPDLTLLSQTYFGFVQSILNFGEAELNFRTGERFSVLGLSQDVVNYSNQQLALWNSRGLATLENAIQTLTEFISTSDPISESVDPSEFEDFRLRVKEMLAQTTLKVSDVQKINDAFEQVVSRATESGEAGVLNLMLEKLNELKTLRNSPSRGTEDNLPIWKIATIVAIFALPLFKVLRCLFRRRCCNTVSGLEGGIYLIVVLSLALC